MSGMRHLKKKLGAFPTRSHRGHGPMSIPRAGPRVIGLTLMPYFDKNGSRKTAYIYYTDEAKNKKKVIIVVDLK